MKGDLQIRMINEIEYWNARKQALEEIEYWNFHKHTHYSNLRTLDVVTKPIDYILRAKELGHTTYFTTEHGWGGNVYEAYSLCKEHGLKCVAGAEVYYVDDRFEKERTNYHLIIIALNQDGFKDINRIVSEANVTGYYYKPRVDLELMLSLNPKNVVVTTACVGGRLFKTENYRTEFLEPMLNHFKEHFFLEVQCHGDEIQSNWNLRVLQLSQEYGINMIHANDSHYINPEDSQYRDLFLKAKGIIYEDESNFILDYPSYNTIVDRYLQQGIFTENQIHTIIQNTRIFEKCEDLGFTKEFKIPKIHSDDSNKRLKNIIAKEWDKHSKIVPLDRKREYIEAIKDEVSTVIECGMSDYFILDYEIVKKAKEEYGGILTKSGRGSAVSFYINKLLGLTEVDRLKAPVTLYPSRFMTAERILASRSLPDIDLNWASVEPVIKASKDILGEDGIYYMIAYKPLQESSAFRLWCKANDMKIDDYNEIAKNIDDYVNDEYWGQIIEASKVFRGVIESVAPSPCSFLLLDKPISEEVGLIKVGNQMCCCLDGYQCDQWKFLKNDYLTVSVYRLISETYNEIGQQMDSIEEMLEKVDETVWKLYEDGITATLNQADSDFARNLIMKYCPKTLAELTAWVSAIRPGFASLLNNFLERKDYTTGVKELDALLEDSYHYMMYQESIMKFLVWLGTPEKDSYDVIKKISKKKFKEHEIEELKNNLKRGWMNKVGKIEGFDENWKVVEDAVRYSFNASHALSVAIDSLYGAFLKRKHTLEYMTVALNEYVDDIEKTDKLCSELDYFGIKLNPPKFRYSKARYMYDKDSNTIYKGIASIKYLNETVSDELYGLKDKHVNSFADLLYILKAETSIDFRQLRILTFLNYFSEFGKNQKLLTIIDTYEKKLKNKSLKEATVIKRLDELRELEASLENKSVNIKEQIKSEKEYLGYECTRSERLPSNVYIVTEIDAKYTPKIRLYSLRTGEIEILKCKKTDLKVKPFGEFSVIKKTGIKRQPKRKHVDGRWVVTEEEDIYLSKWEIIM